MKSLLKLWSDEAGFVVSSELVLIATIVVIGMVTGLATIRDQVVFELADVADAVSELDQTYSISAITAHTSSTNGVNFVDQNDQCEGDGLANDQAPGAPPACVAITAGLSEQ